MELVNAPVPDPSAVLLSAVVGFCEVLQHTPREVTEELPCVVTLPPPVAELVETRVIEVVVTVGSAALAVVKLQAVPVVVVPLLSFAFTFQ